MTKSRELREPVLAEPTSARPSGPAPWARLAALGLACAGAGPLLLMAAILVWGLDIGGDIAFLVVTGGVPVIAAGLVLRFGTWSKLVGGLVGLVVVAMMPWALKGITHPSSVFDFMSGLLIVPGALIGLGASVAALVGSARGWRPAAAEATALRAVVGVLVVAAMCSTALTVVGRSSADATGTGATLQMRSFAFAPASLSVPGGSDLLLDNADPFAHTFTVEALGIDVVLGPGSSGRVRLPATPGTYQFICRPHTESADDPGPEDMVGVLTIE